MDNFKVRSLHLCLAVLSVFLLVDVISSSGLFSYLLVLVVFGSLLVLRFNDNLRLFIFLIPSVYYFFQISGTGNPLSYFLILLFVKYLFYAHNKKFDLINIILAIVVVSLELINLAGNGITYLGDFLRWSSLFLFAILLMSETSSSREFLSYVGYFIFGYFISSFIGLISFYYGGSLYDAPKFIRRFAGLSGDPNNYGMYSLLVLSFLLLLFEGEKDFRKICFMWVGVITVGVLSALTVSRSLLVGYFFIMLVYFILNIRSKKGIAITIMLTLCSVIFGVIGSSYGFFDNYAQRFDQPSLNSLTGSRSIIIMEYLKGFFGGNIFHVFFGSGVVGHMDHYFYNSTSFNLSGYFKNPTGTHNTFIELIVSFGFIGSIPLIVLLYRCIFSPASQKIGRLRYRNLLPLLVILIYFFSLQNLGKYVFYFILVLVAMSLKWGIKNGVNCKIR